MSRSCIVTTGGHHVWFIHHVRSGNNLTQVKETVQQIKYQIDSLKCRYKTIFTSVLHSRNEECWLANATVFFLSTRNVCMDTVDPELKLFHTIMAKESKMINVFLRIGRDPDCQTA